MKPLTPSADLAAVIGAKALPRTETVKLKKVFGNKEVTMFELAGILGKHLS